MWLYQDPNMSKSMLSSSSTPRSVKIATAVEIAQLLIPVQICSSTGPVHAKSAVRSAASMRARFTCSMESESSSSKRLKAKASFVVLEPPESRLRQLKSSSAATLSDWLRSRAKKMLEKKPFILDLSSFVRRLTLQSQAQA